MSLCEAPSRGSHFWFPSPMTAGAHRRRSEGGAADDSHRQERRSRLPVRGSGRVMPRNACRRIPCPRDNALGWTSRFTCAGSARSTRAPFAEGRKPSLASTNSKAVPAARLPRRVLSEPAVDNPGDTSDRRLQPTSSIFKNEHLRLVQLPGFTWETNLPLPGGTTIHHGWSPRFGGPLRRSVRGVFFRVRPKDRASDTPSPHRRENRSSLVSDAIQIGRDRRFP